MNYGKYFRLNQNISKIEEGVAIFDYIDIPAYFESSSKISMSPKYPISVVFTKDSVLFRVHYSAYKVEKEWVEVNKYIYDVEKTYIRDRISPMYNYHAEKNLKHMEEVILKLPFINDGGDELYQTIQKIYNTRYPLLIDKQTTLIYELIEKRYIGGKDGSLIEKKLYKKLRENLDGDSSFSTLWLMDIVENDNEEGTFINLYGKDEQKSIVIKFLRKLLLDFMFDLKHSDVFQTSQYYQAMYTGLMSNFYFSAIMHKCEYYFYRGMITDIIKNENINDACKKKHIQGLYAKELAEAESLWIHDIMSPNAEKYFEHHNTDKISTYNRIVKSIKNILNPYRFVVWDSWFAKPEEEMRRVCFTMKEIEGEEHVCNVETIVEYLQSATEKDESLNPLLLEQLILEKDSFRVSISQWFLKRFDFIDVMHLHTFKYANWLIFTSMLFILALLFLIPQSITQNFWEDNINHLFGGVIAVVTICFIFGITLWTCKPSPKDILKYQRKKLVYKRTVAVLLMVILLVGVLCGFPQLVSKTGWQECMNEESTNGTFTKISYIIIQIGLIVCGGKLVNKLFHLNWLANMHLFYPRLVASIATAWLSLAIGNELFGTFFDSIVSWSTSIWLTVIVFIFVMYEINKMLPFDKIRNKLSRCLGIITISYMISLIVGMFIINFTGERFLERSGVLESFYNDYVDNGEIFKQVENRRYRLITYPSISQSNNCVDTIKGKILIPIKSLRDSVTQNGEIEGELMLVQNDNKKLTDEVLLKKLDSVHIVANSLNSSEFSPQHPIVTKWELGNSNFFILRDFLIQFAFVAMFIGIFIQMIFEEKSITEV